MSDSFITAACQVTLVYSFEIYVAVTDFLKDYKTVIVLSFNL